MDSATHFHKWRKARQFRQELRVRLHEDQGGLCYYCRRMIDWRSDGAAPSRLEHYVPKSRHGQKLVLACEWCDKIKAHMHGARFLRLIGMHMENGVLSDLGRAEVEAKARMYFGDGDRRWVRWSESAPD